MTHDPLQLTCVCLRGDLARAKRGTICFLQTPQAAFLNDMMRHAAVGPRWSSAPGRLSWRHSRLGPSCASAIYLNCVPALTVSVFSQLRL